MSDYNADDFGKDWGQMSWTIVDDTIKRYPEMAKSGWCFSGNINKVDIPTRLTKREDINEKIENYSHMEADAVVIGFNYYAYWGSGKMDPKMLPTFVRVNSEKHLKELGFEERDTSIDEVAVKPNYETTRFELMILGDD